MTLLTHHTHRRFEEAKRRSAAQELDDEVELEVDQTK